MRTQTLNEMIAEVVRIERDCPLAAIGFDGEKIAYTANKAESMQWPVLLKPFFGDNLTELVGEEGIDNLLRDVVLSDGAI